MFIDIAQIPAEGLDIYFREAEDFLDASGERIHLLRPLEATLHFRRTPTGIWVKGEFSSNLELHCSRCDELFTLPVREGFDVRYRNSLGKAADEERELAADELDVSFLDEGRIHVGALVQENVLLALPVQPLCRDGCQGLCTRCGVNLNGSICRCSPTGPDPRWKELESLL